MIRRTLIIVLDSVGIGELPDAADYGDTGSNTLANTAAAAGGLNMPHFAEFGLGNIIDVIGLAPSAHPIANFGKLSEASPGKDTTTGHWELMGVELEREFPLFPRGFPLEVIAEFERRTGRGVLGNKAASGTEIIIELGDEHLRTGKPIVYTSADSVFQIAAHSDLISLEELYKFCAIAREILTGSNGVGRVIARPFTGVSGHFTRTEWRRDFSLEPPAPTLFDHAAAIGIDVHGIGKISEIFAGRSVATTVHTGSNMEGVDQILLHLKEYPEGIIFANLVDFDMLWGHRNDAEAYARGLEQADSRLPDILDNLTADDMLIITADHGCDPTTPSTDHSREYVPLLVYGMSLKRGIDLGIRSTFADVGKTIADAMDFPSPVPGTSFWPEIS